MNKMGIIWWSSSVVNHGVEFGCSPLALPNLGTQSRCIVACYQHRTVRTSACAGFTLIELLVIIAIVSILLALLAPAVMDSRRAARRAQCASRLRQIELATMAFHDAHNMFPPYYNPDAPAPRPLGLARYYSAHCQILPYLEEIALFNALNFQANLGDTSVVDYGLTPLNWDLATNTTVMTTALPVFFCPDDPAPLDPAGSMGTNYRANVGPGVSFGSAIEHLTGPFTNWSAASARDVTDGLSHTVAYSEKPRGQSSRSTFLAFVDAVVAPLNVDPPPPTPFAYCARQPIIPANYRTTTGTNWVVGSLLQTYYNHLEVPNSPEPDCLRLGYRPGYAQATARSYHGPGVNVVLADGSVRFVRGTIQLPVWQALGTRAGGEAISDQDW